MVERALELQPVAPFKGQWWRGEERATTLEINCAKFKIRVEFPECDSAEIEKWLVETLHLWPHPQALTNANDYPAYRDAQYAQLMAK